MSLSRFCVAAAVALGLSFGVAKPASAGFGQQANVLAYYTYLYSYLADQEIGDTATVLAYQYSYFGQLYAYNGLTINKGYFYAASVYFNIVNTVSTNDLFTSFPVNLNQYYSSYFSYWAYYYAWYAYQFGA
jgi:hypothetical protein